MSKAAKKAKPKTVAVHNVGPIGDFSFSLADYGVTVLRASNGSGKSILLDAVAKLAAGDKVKLPLKDGEARGSIEGFGARISVAGQCRHQGEFEVTHLEGRFDLAELVDPGIEDPVKADVRRVKVMVALTGAKADASLFEEHPAFAEVPVHILGGDLLESASVLRRDLQQEALQAEREATRLQGEADALNNSASGAAIVDTDIQVAKSKHELAVQRFHALSERAKVQMGQKQSVEDLKNALCEAKQKPKGESSKSLAERGRSELVKIGDLTHRLEELQQLMNDCERQIADARREHGHIEQLYQQALEQENTTAVLESRIEKATAELAQVVGEEELQKAKAAVEDAYGLIQAAQRSEEAKRQLSVAKAQENAAQECAAKAEKLRKAAASVDEVLSQAIKCPALRVEQVDGKARLVTDHPKRGVTPYSELSEGERWRVAIDLGADQVGKGGLLVIPQGAWESLDSFTRPLINAHAKERRVYVLTAEATRDQRPDMVAEPFEGAA